MHVYATLLGSCTARYLPRRNLCETSTYGVWALCARGGVTALTAYTPEKKILIYIKIFFQACRRSRRSPLPVRKVHRRCRGDSSLARLGGLSALRPSRRREALGRVWPKPRLDVEGPHVGVSALHQGVPSKQNSRQSAHSALGATPLARALSPARAAYQRCDRAVGGKLSVASGRSQDLTSRVHTSGSAHCI